MLLLGALLFVIVLFANAMINEPYYDEDDSDV